MTAQKTKTTKGWMSLDTGSLWDQHFLGCKCKADDAGTILPPYEHANGCAAERLSNGRTNVVATLFQPVSHHREAHIHLLLADGRILEGILTRAASSCVQSSLGCRCTSCSLDRLCLNGMLLTSAAGVAWLRELFARLQYDHAAFL